MSYLSTSCWIILSVLPALIIRIGILLRGQKISLIAYVASIGQELFFSTLLLACGLLIGKWIFLPIALFQCLVLLDALLYKRLGVRLEWEYLKMIRELHTMWSSVRALGLFLFAIGMTCLFTYAMCLMLAYQDSLSFSEIGVTLAISSVSCLIRGDSFSQTCLLLFRKSNKCQYELKKEFFSPSKGLAHPHVIIVLMESFRSKDLCEKNSPHFCSLIKEGIYFPHFYANAVKSNLAALSTLQGIPMLFNSMGYHTAYLHNGDLSFARQRELFKKLGFQTLVGRNEILTAFPEAKGNSWGIFDEYLMEYAVGDLAKRSYPTLMTLATMSNHHPWTTPPSYEPKHTKREKFLQTFHYSDATLGRLIALLKQQDLYRQSLIVVLGDHGQPMGEHKGNFLAPSGLYEENVHIPLLILGQVSPDIRTCIGSQVDLLPTLKDLLKITPIDPKSLLQDTGERIACFQSTFGQGFLGCREGRYKYIHTVASQQDELFDLDVDPEEKVNLVDVYPEHVRRFYKIVTNYPFPQVPDSLPTDETHLIHLTGSISVTDAHLEQMALSLPHVQIAHLNDTLLLSNRGVGALLKNCPHLEHVNITGVGDVTDAVFDCFLQPNMKMVRFEMLHCPYITGRGLSSLIKYCPNLHTLSICCAQIQAFPSEVLPYLESLHLQQGQYLTDDLLIAFLKRHLRLEYLILEECPQLTDAGVAALAHLGLKRLKLFSCNGITDVGLQAFQQSSLVLLEIYNCQNVTPTALQNLSAQGLHILS